MDAATELFATQPFERVTVAAIAEAAAMTSAAVYYHFPAKEQILLETIRTFGDDLLAHVRAGLDSGIPAPELVVDALLWLVERRHAASVALVRSVGQSLTVEATHRGLRIELTNLFRLAARRTRPGLSRAEAGVSAVALVSLLDLSAGSWLTEDRDFLAIGADSFAAEVGRLAARIVG